MSSNLARKTAAIMLPTDDDPCAEIANEAGGQFGKILKYVKAEWSHADEPVAIGTEFLALVNNAMRGDVRFENGVPVEHRVGLIREHARFARRADLGFTDQTLWEKKQEGRTDRSLESTNLPAPDPHRNRGIVLLDLPFGRREAGIQGFVPRLLAVPQHQDLAGGQPADQRLLTSRLRMDRHTSPENRMLGKRNGTAERCRRQHHRIRRADSNRSYRRRHPTGLRIIFKWATVSSGSPISLGAPCSIAFQASACKPWPLRWAAWFRAAR